MRLLGSNLVRTDLAPRVKRTCIGYPVSHLHVLVLAHYDQALRRKQGNHLNNTGGVIHHGHRGDLLLHARNDGRLLYRAR